MGRERRCVITVQSPRGEGEHSTPRQAGTTDKATYWPRVWSSVFYAMVALAFPILFECFLYDKGNADSDWAKVLYADPKPGSCNLGRFVWCISSSFLGFAGLSVLLWEHRSRVYPRHVWYYPFVLLAISSLVFSACHMLQRTSGFVFYYLSFGACFSRNCLPGRKPVFFEEFAVSVRVDRLLCPLIFGIRL
jgi:hypothetical protein